MKNILCTLSLLILFSFSYTYTGTTQNSSPQHGTSHHIHQPKQHKAKAVKQKPKAKVKKSLHKQHIVVRQGKLGVNGITSLTTENFEGVGFPPSGWTVGNDDADYTWEKDSSISGYNSGTSSAYLDFYDYGSIGEYDSLKTPILTGLASGDSLKFDLAYARYDVDFTDTLKIVISTDGGVTFPAINKIYQKGGLLLKSPNTSNDNVDPFYPNANQWKTERVALPATVTGNNVVVAFIGINGNGQNLFLDNVRIGATPQFDLGVTGISLLPALLVEGVESQVTATVKWEGLATPPSSVSLTYKLNSAPADSLDGVHERITVSFAGSPPVASVAFSVPFVPPEGSFKLYVRGFATGDGSSGNDVFFQNLYATFVVHNFPYLENFEGPSDSGWASGGIASPSEWVRDTPSKIQIASAHSGTKAWVTGTSANYGDNINEYVLSPIFDFSGFAHDPVLNIYNNFVSEYGFDGGAIEYSIDGGNFTVLGEYDIIDPNIGYNWYNNDAGIGGDNPTLNGPNWGGSSVDLENPDSAGWTNSRLTLAGFQGLSNVQFRFRFVSDVSNNDEGWAFDDVYIYEGGVMAGNVFEDIDGNGQVDNGDLPVSDVEVDLFGTEERYVYTDVDGYYEMSGLQPGVYTDSLSIGPDQIVTVPSSPFYHANVNINANNADGLDFGIFTLGSVSGQNFNDANGNRTKDVGEGGLQNWTIILTGTITETTHTNITGNYSFTSLPPGNYTISEVKQVGFSQSVPSYPGVHHVTITSGANISDLNFGNGNFGSISGRVYNDMKSNGVIDSIDTGLLGWSAILQGASAETLLTDSSGYYSFLPVFNGIYNLSAETKSGYTTTSPASVSYTDTISGNEITGHDFGRYKLGSISGQKFEDKNGNGIKDTNDAGIANWGITLSNGMQTLTGIDGNFTFTQLPYATYIVSETAQSGWTQTAPFDTTFTIELLSGLDSQNINFGNFKDGSISGMKFEDMNANGILDSNDVPLMDWQISYVNGSHNGTTLTDNAGNYSFTNLGPGTYTITETMQNGYHQSLPNGDGTYSISLQSGDSLLAKNFGNYRLGSIGGKKYLDGNVNGTLDTNEAGLANWTIHLSNGDSTVTDSVGNYLFANLVPNAYTVTESLLPTWTQSEPINGSHNVVILSNVNLTGKNFGNYQKGSITGYVYTDSSENGTKDSTDAGLGLWKVFLSSVTYGTDSTVTDSAGMYSFTQLIPAAYSITVSPLNQTYFYSEPLGTVIEQTISSGLNVSAKNFGLYQLASISGAIYTDKNRDRIKNNAETGLNNWQIKLSGAKTDSTVSDTSGNFTFSNLHPGTYIVKEVLQSTWVQTAPVDSIFTFTLVSGANKAGTNFGNFSDTASFRTFIEEIALSGKPISLKLKKNKPIPIPNIVNALDTVFKKILPVKTGIVLGYVRMKVGKVDSSKYYCWIRWKTPTDFGKEYLGVHTAPPYPLDSLRVGKKFKKLSKEYKPAWKTYKNPLVSAYGIFKLNIAASQFHVTPDNFGDLKYIGPESLLTGRTMVQMASLIDSVLTYYKAIPLDTNQLHRIINVLDTINSAFYAPIDSFGNISCPPLTMHGVRKVQDVPFLSRNLGKHQEMPTQPDAGFGEPDMFTLYQNYPNPFNPATTIQFYIPEDALVTMQVFNILGQKVADVLSREEMGEGTNEISFDASRLSSGVYFYRITAAGNSTTYQSVKKMMLIK